MKSQSILVSIHPEEKIIQLIEQQHYEAAVKAIVESYSNLLYAHVIRMLKNESNTKDVLQNTFLKVWKGIARFRQESKLSTWLIAIATNEAYNSLRKQSRSATSPLTLREEAVSMDGLDGNQIEKKLNQAIELLPIKQKQVFILRYFDELKYSEMSAMLNTSEGALKASYHHAVKKIEEFLKAD